MTKKYPEIIRHRTIEGHLEAGWMTPQFLMQVTPLKWGFSYIYCSTRGRPTKFGLKVGCVSFVLYIGPGPYTHEVSASDREHITFGAKKNG